MAFTHGKETFFSIDNAAGTPTTLSTFITNIDFSRDVDTPETTTYGDSDREYITGLRGATISVSGIWDNTASTGPDAVLAGILGSSTSKSFVYGPEGNTSGDIRYTGECIATSYSTSSPVDGVTTFTFDAQITGAITRDTF